ncbi:ABC transporter ATP-binding protein [Mangrovibacillus cuniculi]|uniref:ABC transporter ATP-binding protein n=1 Tax=Mangrovibacillus cuniculi TaxID=2593652 RepID=A0A7S8C9X0_9BACI|nr:ABC transporter ATP-binding protein [Mangrovibacillus cuniculi]QPC45956.1 ABC transporter ATP-binding protein [Mangrovibacillus cuniculi]
MSVGRRLTQYALHMKGMIVFALFMLTIAVAAELGGPYIAKIVIDDHVLGIESNWYQVNEKATDTVEFNGNYYVREKYASGVQKAGAEVSVVQVERDFIFVNEPVPLTGGRSFENGVLTISENDRVENFSAQKIPATELFGFFQPEVKRIAGWLSFYLGLLIFAAFFQYGQRYYLQKAANRIIQKMRNDVFQHISRLPIKYFDNLPAGKVVARITNDTEAIRDLYVTVLSTFFASAINMIGIYIALFILDVQLASIVLILIPILVVWIWFYRKYASKYNRVIRSKNSEINAMVNESINGMTIIQAFRREKKTNEEFEELNKTHFEYQNKLLNLNSLLSHNMVNILRTAALFALVWYFGAGSLQIQSFVTLGVLYAFVEYLSRLFHPVSGIVNQLANLEQALVAGERVFKLMDEDGVDVEDQKMQRYEGNVAFKDVSFAYKGDDYVLKNISFEAKKGETVALVGHTGSGKSSIMNLLFRFYDSSKGEIVIDGKNIQDIPLQTLRDHMGIVLQDPYLFTGTIASNVSLDDPRISREIVEKALKDVGADRVFTHLENGYDEPVIEKGSTLSSGQRQLISFARALAFNPAILILDEATSSIDTETESIIQEAMEVLKKGRTTFMIAHRLSTIKNADQILVLDRGEIVEKGSHDELMEKKGKYYQMYELQKGNIAS